MTTDGSWACWGSAGTCSRTSKPCWTGNARRSSLREKLKSWDTCGKSSSRETWRFSAFARRTNRSDEGCAGRFICKPSRTLVRARHMKTVFDVTELQQGDHVCLLHRTPTEQRDALIAFIKEGMTR